MARFNTKAGSTDKRYFQGLPSPAAAAVVIGMVWALFNQGYTGKELAPIALVLTVISGLLMVSNISYYSFKDLDFKNKVPFIAIMAVVLVFVLASIDPPKILFGCFLIYALSGPVVSVLRKIKKRSQRQPE